jgi:precorrin-6B methylase 2
MAAMSVVDDMMMCEFVDGGVDVGAGGASTVVSMALLMVRASTVASMAALVARWGGDRSNFEKFRKKSSSVC